MTYNAQGIGKSGARKRLVEEVVKAVEMRDRGRCTIECFHDIADAVNRYKKDVGK